jgi:hypothetical protein
MIFMTGAAFTDVSRRFLDAVSNPVLDKPFTYADFKKAVELLPWRLRVSSGTRLKPTPAEAIPVVPSIGRARDRH